MRELLGTESPPVRRFAIAFAGIGGFVLASTLYLLLARGEPMMFVLSVVPGLLSAYAVGRATQRPREVGDVASAIVGRSVLAAVFCPFVTGALALGFAYVGGNGGNLDQAVLFTCVGGGVAAFFAAPLGFVFGVVYALVWQRLEATRASGRSAQERLWMLFGVAFATLGAMDLTLSRALSQPFGPLPEHDMLVPLGVGALVFGALTFLRGAILAARRRRVLRSVARGEVAGYALVPASEFADVDPLPDLFGRHAGQVLVRRAPGRDGPFRATEAIEPLARL